MEDGNILKVMYDSLSDQALLQKEYNSHINSILDLRPASDLLQYEKKDLGSVLEKTLGIGIEKKKRFQRYNWTRRPIEEEAIEYALSDVLHLLRLKDAMLHSLLERKLMDDFLLKNLNLQNRDFGGDRKPRIFKSGEFNRLPKNGKRLFEQVYEVRDRHARDLNVPPDTVLNKLQMFALASGRAQPEDLSVNRRIPPDVRSRLIEDLRALYEAR
jgi:ribonuclease D